MKIEKKKHKIPSKVSFSELIPVLRLGKLDFFEKTLNTRDEKPNKVFIRRFIPGT